jgi:hypothetical protein
MEATKPAAAMATFLNCILSDGTAIELKIFSECKLLQ